MSVSGQEQDLTRSARADGAAERGPRARMKRHMLDAAMRLMQGGTIPSVSDVAEAAEVSRATAYRYFPSQAAMIQAAVDEALGPILGWTSDCADAGERVRDLLSFSLPRMETYEATHRAALLLALDQWTRRQAGTLGAEAPVVRGNRKGLLREAIAPLRPELSRQAFDKVAQSLSLIFGVEAMIILKDIWKLDGDEARRVVLWAAQALVRTAVTEASANKQVSPQRGTKRNAARRPQATMKRV